MHTFLSVIYVALLSKFDNILTFVLAFSLSSMFSYEYNEWLVKGRLYNYNAKAWLYLQPIYIWWPQSCAGFTYAFHISALIRFSGMSLAFLCSYTYMSMKRRGGFSFATKILVQAWICPRSGAELPATPPLPVPIAVMQQAAPSTSSCGPVL